MSEGRGTGSAGPIWIDLDNAPHVPFFRPLIRGLERRGHRVWVTCRDDGVVPELARVLGVPCATVGRGRARTRVGKGLTVLRRGAALAAAAGRLPAKPMLAVSHGSRAQALAARALGVPSLCLLDYEYVAVGLLRRCVDRFLVPDRLQDDDLQAAGFGGAEVRRYPGLKEEVYLFAPGVASEPGPADTRAAGGTPDVIVVYRPESETAHYLAGEETSDVEEALIDHVASAPGVRVRIMPRTPGQGARLERELTRRGAHVEVLSAVDGRVAIEGCDLVISGGGTMAREAAALGVPAYSIFRGRTGGVDRELAREGRLRLIRTREDVRHIRLEKRNPRAGTVSSAGYESVLQQIEEMGVGKTPGR